MIELIRELRINILELYRSAVSKSGPISPDFFLNNCLEIINKIEESLGEKKSEGNLDRKKTTKNT